MIKMVLVDDEPGQVSEMSAIIRILRPDIEVYETTSASKALEYAQTHPVDVMMTDIRMPQIDGLELTEKILGLDKQIMVVILSGYGEFQYAQRAIQYGVLDYLVKPISKAGLERLFARIDSKMEEKNVELEGKQQLQKELDTSRPVYLEHLLNKWVQQELNANELEELTDTFPARGDGLVFVTRIDKYKRLANLYKPEEIGSLLSHFKARIQEVLRDEGRSVSFVIEARNDLLATVLCADTPNRCEGEPFERKLNELIAYAESELGLPVTIGISKKSADVFNEVRECYGQAASALDFSFFSDGGNYFLYSKLCIKAEKNQQFNIYELERKLSEEIKNENISRIYAIINDTFELLSSRQTMIRPHQLKEYFVYIALNMMKLVNISSLDDYYNELMEQVTAQIYSCDNYGELRKTIKDIMEKLVGLKTNKDVNKNYTLIQKCKKYIDDKYMEDISLETLAGMFYFNPSYLSNLFKTYAGMSYSEYLTDVRIQKAQHLLKNSKDKIYSIALKVGYNDATYLIKIFKRKVGISPYKYRQLFVDQ